MPNPFNIPYVQLQDTLNDERLVVNQIIDALGQVQPKNDNLTELSNVNLSPNAVLATDDNGDITQIPSSDIGRDLLAATTTSAAALILNTVHLENNLVPSANLPSYVDDVIEYASRNDFPVSGETGKIYVAVDTNFSYRWSGSTYVDMSRPIDDTDDLPEGVNNLYFTTARARAAAGPITTTFNPSLVGSTDVGSATYTTRSGHQTTQVDSVVTTIQLTVDSLGGATGQLKIAGDVVLNSSETIRSVYIPQVTMVYGGVVLFAQKSPNESEILLYKTSNLGFSSPLLHSDVTLPLTLNFTIHTRV